jgi:uncharacterized protein YecT (DUF1311 family)
MRVALALALLAAFLQAKAVDAQAPVWYWCEPLSAYYPWVARCPVPWRSFDPATVLQHRNATSPELPPPTSLTSRSATIGEPTPLLPTTYPDNSMDSGGALDEWCSNVKLASSIAICSEPELRALMLERQHAYDEANARLSPVQRRALAADQSAWVKSYPQDCGLSPDTPPPLPLAPAIRDCMAQAGRARVTYLRAYGLTSPMVAVTSASPIPSVQLPADRIDTSPASSEKPSTVALLLAIGGVLVIGAAIKARAKAADRRQRIEQACAYINNVNERRHFPEIAVGINLQPGEFGLLQARAQLSEMRSHRYSTGGSVRIAKGVWVGGRQYHSYRTRDIVDQGVVVITTRRVAYTGGSKTAQVWLLDLVSIEGNVDCNVLHTARRQNAIVIHYREAALGLILVRVLASAVLAGNRLPNGWQLTARPNGAGIAVDVGDAASPVAS